MGKHTLIELRPFPQIVLRGKVQTDFARRVLGRMLNNEAAFRWLNRDFIGALKRLHPPGPGAAGRRVADDLKANGIAFARLDEFVPREAYDALKAEFAKRLEAFREGAGGRKGGKAIYLDTIYKAHTFTPGDVTSAYLGEPAFAAVAAAYMGMVPRFVGTSFWHTRVISDGERRYSQLWHRDYNDRRLVKVFLYLCDVGRENGYFEYLSGSHVGGPLGGKFDRIGEDGLRAYPNDEAVSSLVETLPVVELCEVPASRMSGATAPWFGKPSVLRCMAPEATLIFADTFGLHRGGYVVQGHRDMIMTTYSTNFNVHKPHFSVTPEFAWTLSPFMHKVFGLG